LNQIIFGSDSGRDTGFSVHIPTLFVVVFASQMKDTTMKNFFNKIFQFFSGALSQQMEVSRALSGSDDLVELEQMQKRMAPKH
jgi:hypothetical protein